MIVIYTLVFRVLIKDRDLGTDSTLERRTRVEYVSTYSKMNLNMFMSLPTNYK